jgi:hypothetical protein
MTAVVFGNDGRNIFDPVTGSDRSPAKVYVFEPDREIALIEAA